MTFRIDDTASRNSALLGAVIAAAVLVIAAVFEPKIAAAGWLVGFTFWAQILLGSLTLAMIHRLTSGRWGEIAAPVIEPACAAVPLLIAFAIPVFVAIPVLYPWVHGAPGTTKHEVLLYYLNVPSYIARSMVALLGWSALALLLPRTIGRPGQLLAALGLVFYALVISSIAVDWYLSAEVPFTSSSFGASVAISSLVGALAWTVLTLPIPADDPALGDLGGLLLATVLGITYMDFMAVLVIWYGDIPREEIWFVARNRFPWDALAFVAFFLTSVFPVLALLLSRVRNARRPAARRWRLRSGRSCLLRRLFDCAAIGCLHAGDGNRSGGGDRARPCGPICQRLAASCVILGAARCPLKSICNTFPSRQRLRFASSVGARSLRSFCSRSGIGVFYEIYQAAVPIKTVPAPRTFAEPRVTTHAADVAELHRLDEEQSHRLNTWGWANDQHTLIQIPIERAMQLLAQKGGEAWAPLLPPQPTLSSATAAAQRANTPNSPRSHPQALRRRRNNSEACAADLTIVESRGRVGSRICNTSAAGAGVGAFHLDATCCDFGIAAAECDAAA